MITRSVTVLNVVKKLTFFSQNLQRNSQFLTTFFTTFSTVDLTRTTTVLVRTPVPEILVPEIMVPEILVPEISVPEKPGATPFCYMARPARGSPGGEGGKF